MRGSVRELLADLDDSPDRFREADGYERLVEALNAPGSAEPMLDALESRGERAGDLLWVICQLPNVALFVSGAIRYLQDEDKGVVAYAMEIVLRGARKSDDLRCAMEQLRTCHVDVCEHAVRTLVGEGARRMWEISRLSGQFGGRPVLPEEVAVANLSAKDAALLLDDEDRIHQVFGAALFSLASEEDQGLLRFLRSSKHEWVREYGRFLDELADQLKAVRSRGRRTS